jgi:hypothetical protein
MKEDFDIDSLIGLIVVCTSHGPKTFIELDNTYTLNQQYDDSYSGASTKYKASFALALDKVYLEI